MLLTFFPQSVHFAQYLLTGFALRYFYACCFRRAVRQNIALCAVDRRATSFRSLRCALIPRRTDTSWYQFQHQHQTQQHR